MTVFGGGLLIFLGILTDRYTKKLIEANNEEAIKNNTATDQATRNAEVIHVMGFLGNIVEEWQKLNTKVHSTRMVISKRQAVLSEITKFVRTFLQTTVMAVGAYLVIKMR